MLTGARRGEVLGATWDMFDLENGIWTKPSAHTKQRLVHRVPLSGPALRLLTDIRVTQPAWLTRPALALLTYFQALTESR